MVTTTAGDRADLERIARELVDRRLAACVQIEGPILSVYRWQGQVETAHEWRCTVKPRRSLYAGVERAIAELHPYETPEIVSVELTGSPSYLAWIDANTDE